MSLLNFTSNNRCVAALDWLERGQFVAPAQPGSKHLVEGYGPNRRTIKTPAEAHAWFSRNELSNLVVVCRDDLIALDFDSPDILGAWLADLPTRLYASYQEASPHGHHYFFRCRVPEGLRLVPGVEVKRAILACPSVVDGRPYVSLGRDLEVVAVADWREILFSLLSEKGPAREAPRLPENPPAGNDLVARLKAAFPVYDLAASLTELKPSDRSGRWWKARCPFHDDHEPSFWLDRERGLWGCHACGIRGDAINLYARAHDLTLQAAIRELVSRMGEVEPA